LLPPTLDPAFHLYNNSAQGDGKRRGGNNVTQRVVGMMALGAVPSCPFVPVAGVAGN
jgi:hypothetical protein